MLRENSGRERSCIPKPQTHSNLHSGRQESKVRWHMSKYALSVSNLCLLSYCTNFLSFVLHVFLQSKLKGVILNSTVDAKFLHGCGMVRHILIHNCFRKWPTRVSLYFTDLPTSLSKQFPFHQRMQGALWKSNAWMWAGWDRNFLQPQVVRRKGFNMVLTSFAW